jgi:Bacterial Ig domain
LTDTTYKNMRNKQMNKLIAVATFAGITANLLPIQQASAQVATPTVSIAEFQGDCDNGIGNEETYYIRIGTGLYSINGNDKNRSGVTVLLNGSGNDKYDPSNPSDIHKTNLRNAIIGAGQTTATANRVIAALDAAERIFCGSSGSSTGGVTVTIEAATVQTTRLPNSNYYVVDFNDRTGRESFTKTNGTTTYAYSNNLDVQNANQWGGANGSKFITQASGKNSYKVTINEDQRYFGFWWSAGDGANKITFKNDGNAVRVFQTSDLTNFINGSAAYKGNPNCPADNSGPCSGQSGHRGEPYAFVNVFFDNQVYDEIIVETLNNGGPAFESDNHTFSAMNQLVSGSVVRDAVPPNPPVVTSISNPTTNPTVTGTAEPNSTITIRIGDVITTTTTDPNGNWTANLPIPIPSDDRPKNVTATDPAGNTSTPTPLTAAD